MSFLGYPHLSGYQRQAIQKAIVCLARGDVSGAQVELHDAEERAESQLAMADAEIAGMMERNPYMQTLSAAFAAQFSAMEKPGIPVSQNEGGD